VERRGAVRVSHGQVSSAEPRTVALEPGRPRSFRRCPEAGTIDIAGEHVRPGDTDLAGLANGHFGVGPLGTDRYVHT